MLPSHLLSGAASFLRKKHVGLPPGSVVFVGEDKAGPVHFSVMDYTADHLDEATFEDVEEMLPYRDSPTAT